MTLLNIRILANIFLALIAFIIICIFVLDKFKQKSPTHRTGNLTTIRRWPRMIDRRVLISILLAIIITININIIPANNLISNSATNENMHYVFIIFIVVYWIIFGIFIIFTGITLFVGFASFIKFSVYMKFFTVVTIVVGIGGGVGGGVILTNSLLSQYNMPSVINVPDLQVSLTYNHQMNINHSSSINVSLTSKDNIPLSHLNATIPGLGSGPLGILLGSDAASCVSIALVADNASFSISSPQSVAFPLNQDSVEYTWEVKPLQADVQAQQIPINIMFSGGSLCSERDLLKGQYSLAPEPNFNILVVDPNNTVANHVTGSPAFGPVLTAILALITALIGWGAKSLWERITKKKAREEAERLAQERQEEIIKRAREEAEGIKKKSREEAEDIKKKSCEEAEEIIKKALEEAERQMRIKQEQEDMKQSMFRDMIGVSNLHASKEAEEIIKKAHEEADEIKRKAYEEAQEMLRKKMSRSKNRKAAGSQM